jgi:hypothetical protein
MRLRNLLACSATLCAIAAVAPRSWAADELLPPETTIEAAIDHYVNAGVQAAGVSAAPQADDATMLRRTMLDLAGRIPTVAEAQAYLAATDADATNADKRTQLVDRLLASPAFVRQQAADFDALLMNGTRQSVREYLSRAFRENRRAEFGVRFALGRAQRAMTRVAILVRLEVRLGDPSGRASAGPRLRRRRLREEW